jgi:hypothetical protein
MINIHQKWYLTITDQSNYQIIITIVPIKMFLENDSVKIIYVLLLYFINWGVEQIYLLNLRLKVNKILRR